MPTQPMQDQSDQVQQMWIRDFVKKDGPYDEIYYAGDGSNDFCPTLEIDCFAYPRAGFPLDKLIKEKGKVEKSMSWTSGLEIIEDLKKKHEKHCEWWIA